MPRTRLTGFSRLLIFLLIALPIIYFAASYYNGEDPVANVKGWLGMHDDAVETVEPSRENTPRDAPATFENVQDLRAENERLREELARCRSQTGS
jgi:hypothetical protein